MTWCNNFLYFFYIYIQSRVRQRPKPPSRGRGENQFRHDDGAIYLLIGWIKIKTKSVHKLQFFIVVVGLRFVRLFERDRYSPPIYEDFLSVSDDGAMSE